MSLGNSRIFDPEKVGYSDSVEIIREDEKYQELHLIQCCILIMIMQRWKEN